jgi:DNA polymerase-3 subunit chi
MPQVDFYLISEPVAHAQFKLASRLAKKLQGLQQSMLLVTASTTEAADLDNMMWTFSDTSFVVHDRIPETQQPQSNTHIIANGEVDAKELSHHYDVLINLSSEATNYQSGIGRVAEIVTADESARASARQRYKRYLAEGYEIKTHNIEL